MNRRQLFQSAAAVAVSAAMPPIVSRPSDVIAAGQLIEMNPGAGIWLLSEKGLYVGREVAGPGWDHPPEVKAAIANGTIGRGPALLSTGSDHRITSAQPV